MALSIELVEGDLLDQPVDAIVNAWNRNLIPWWLLLPQGVSGAIKRRAGYDPFWELGWRPLPLGQARHTGAGALPYKGIIHVAGIDGLWRASPTSIADSARNAVSLAVERGYSSLAMPIIGAGSGGMGEEEALGHLLGALRGIEVEAGLGVRVVRFRG